MPHKLLIVDDEKDILLTLTLTFRDDYEVFTAQSGAEALGILEKQDIALIIADQRMPAMTGVEFLQRSININPDIIRIILTGYTDTAALIQAINQGHIYQYVTKPWERYELKMVVRRALDSYDLVQENKRLLQELASANSRLKDENSLLRKEVCKNFQSAQIIGNSVAMRWVIDRVNRVVDTPTTVLLTGETGTGKTLIARYIHYQSPRKDKLFVEQNCGAIPETLLESELFGHKRGAFTGASHDKKGLFEAADGGTLFLDEISEMSPLLQVKLLQVLQEGHFRRVGDTSYRQTDVRIVTATNQDLETAIQKGRFRSDLYYRINVFPIHIPPLRERLDDIPLLANYYLNKNNLRFRSQFTGFEPEVLEQLGQYHFPGNVRELENLIERAFILSTGSRIEVGDWLPKSRPSLSGLTRMEKIERAEIIRLLEVHNGKYTLVAAELEMGRSTLWRRIRDYGIQTSKKPEVSEQDD